MILTADTITDEQIRELWRANAGLTGRTLMIALGEPFPWGEFPSAEETRQARARCAEILNARNAEWSCPSEVPGCTESTCRHVAPPEHAP